MRMHQSIGAFIGTRSAVEVQKKVALDPQDFFPFCPLKISRCGAQSFAKRLNDLKMEAAKMSLITLGSFSKEVVEERLLEARKSYKLNLG